MLIIVGNSMLNTNEIQQNTKYCDKTHVNCEDFSQTENIIIGNEHYCCKAAHLLLNPLSAFGAWQLSLRFFLTLLHVL